MIRMGLCGNTDHSNRTWISYPFEAHVLLCLPRAAGKLVLAVRALVRQQHTQGQHAPAPVQHREDQGLWPTIFPPPSAQTLLQAVCDKQGPHPQMGRGHTLPCIIRWLIHFWTLHILKRKAGSHWLDPIPLAPLRGQNGDIVFCGDRCENSPGAECKKVHPHNWENSLPVSSCDLRLKNRGTISEETLNISWDSISGIGLRSLSLLPRLSSRFEHSAVLWSCLIHSLMGFTRHSYTTPVFLTKEIFLLLKEKKAHTSKKWTWAFPSSKGWS